MCRDREREREEGRRRGAFLLLISRDSLVDYNRLVIRSLRITHTHTHTHRERRTPSPSFNRQTFLHPPQYLISMGKRKPFKRRSNLPILNGEMTAGPRPHCRSLQARIEWNPADSHRHRRHHQLKTKRNATRKQNKQRLLLLLLLLKQQPRATRHTK